MAVYCLIFLFFSTSRYYVRVEKSPVKAQADSVASPAERGTGLSAQHQRELDAAQLIYTEADWLELMAKIATNAALSKQLLGDDVNEDNMNERLGMLLMRKRRELAEQSRVKPMNKTQQRDFMRDFVKNQSALVYNQGWTMKQVPASIPAAPFTTSVVFISAALYVPADTEVNANASRLDDTQTASEHVSTEHNVDESTPSSSRTRRKQIAKKRVTPIVDVADDALIKFDSASDSDDDPLPYTPYADWEMVPTPLGFIHAYYDMEGHTKHFTSLREILHMVEKNDLRKLLGAVDNFYQRHEPDTFALILCGDLRVLFQSLADEDAHAFWHNQDSWRIRSWRLNPRAQVHVLETVDGRVIYMFVDVSYPLSADTLKRMLKHGLEVSKMLVGGDLTMAEQLVTQNWMVISFFVPFWNEKWLVQRGTTLGKDISNPFMAVMVCQKPLGYFSSPMIHVLRAGLVINLPGFTWVFFLATKDETSPNLKTFINGLENQLSLRTPQQNGITERKNRTLIEAARTMLADSLLPIPFWVEAVNTACYVQNRVLVTKPQNKTLYELLHGRTLSIGFMRPFGCLVTILNTLDPLGKFEGKVDEGFLVGYSVNSKAFRVFNSRTRIIQETLHVNFLENKPNIVCTGPTWLFDIDSLRRTINYQPVTAGNQSNPSAERDVAFDGKEHDAKKPESAVNLSPSTSAQSGRQDDMTKKKDKGKSHVEYFTRNRDLMQILKIILRTGVIMLVLLVLLFILLGKITLTALTPLVLLNEDIIYSDHENVGAEADFNNLETSITVSLIPTTRTNKDHPENIELSQ
nr:hypothetical protein [Tanacetum cinerariifolium]